MLSVSLPHLVLGCKQYKSLAINRIWVVKRLKLLVIVSDIPNCLVSPQYYFITHDLTVSGHYYVTVEGGGGIFSE